MKNGARAMNGEGLRRAVACALCAWALAGEPATLAVRRFEPESNVCRAGRVETVVASVENLSADPVRLAVRLTVPEGVRVVSDTTEAVVPADGQALLRWQVEASGACGGELAAELQAAGKTAAKASIRVCFLPPAQKQVLAEIPPPAPVRTEMLVGAHNCPLWEARRPEMWNNILKHPERLPALGFYSQENPEVADWETKWAVEHGVSFFIYCWYRTAQGGPVKTQFSSAIHDALYRSRFRDEMKYAIMWENQSRGTAGVADERDLFENLLPFWLENYFRHPSYLKVDNKPVLFIYRPEFLIQDLGGEAAVARALERMRQVCRDAGFAGLTILGEYRGLDPRQLELMRRLGLDYTFAYCWYVPNSPAPEEAVAQQMSYIRKTQEIAALPQVVTVSQAWSGWSDEGSIWKIPPAEFESLLRQAKAFAETLPDNQLGRHMLLLDNWNEWGEGHYIAPYREYGFGYLDAVRRVFAPDAGPHADLLPEDVGLGPYDAAIRSALQQREAARTAARRRITKPGADEPGLVAWWAFDEEVSEPAVFDCAGGRRGGQLLGASRAAGLDGSALVCTGGCVRIESDPAFSASTGVTVTCWVKTSVSGQTQAWIVNRIQGGGESTGYRLGVMEGRPCFNVPQTAWSHTAQADQCLPTNRWVHLAGTFDGANVRIYVDGEACGAVARPGRLGANEFPVCLGSFAPSHAAHFTGLLDEVRLYDRALPPEALRAQYENGRAKTTPRN